MYTCVNDLPEDGVQGLKHAEGTSENTNSSYAYMRN
jgi:hypothetical protein